MGKSTVKNSTTAKQIYSSKRRGKKESGIKKPGSAMSATRGLHGGRRKAV